MSESGPIRKIYKDPETGYDFCDFQRITENVWRASRDGKHWLLKTAAGNDAASVQLLRREYEISCGLQHPFIISVNRFEEDTVKGPAIVMEYIAGRTLRKFTEERPSQAKRRKILTQLLDAVEYLHRVGVLHNDIKPENVLVTDIGDDVKLIDFGLGETDAGFLERRLGGTRGASAPEVLNGDTSSPSTAASDIYAIGGIIGLLFPAKYAGIVRKCHRNRPEGRYKDISSLRAAINRRDRIPWVIFALILFCTVLAIALIPYIMVRTHEEEKLRQESADTVIVPEKADRAVKEKVIDSNGAEKRQFEKQIEELTGTIRKMSNKAEAEAAEEERFQARIRQVRKDMTVFYNEAADSIGNRELVPYQEFASLTRQTFVVRTVNYSKSLEPEMRPVCDSIYARMIIHLSEMMRDIPSFSVMESKGLISIEEERWYYQLFMNDKPYSPYIPGK